MSDGKIWLSYLTKCKLEAALFGQGFRFYVLQIAEIDVRPGCYRSRVGLRIGDMRKCTPAPLIVLVLLAGCGPARGEPAAADSQQLQQENAKLRVQIAALEKEAELAGDGQTSLRIRINQLSAENDSLKQELHKLGPSPPVQPSNSDGIPKPALRTLARLISLQPDVGSWRLVDSKRYGDYIFVRWQFLTPPPQGIPGDWQNASTLLHVKDKLWFGWNFDKLPDAKIRESLTKQADEWGAASDK
jgi:hypothetical protein